MNLGEPFKHEMRISPGGDGTFIVDVFHDTEKHVQFGFTTIDDLLIWMARHGTKARVTELKEGDVVKPAYEYQKSGMDALNGLRRTTAAEIIREREVKAYDAAKNAASGEEIDGELLKRLGKASGMTNLRAADGSLVSTAPAPNDAA